jgi:hypothetical protein
MEIALRHETAESIRVRPPESEIEAEIDQALPESSHHDTPELIEASR